jgi:hypothetical protein
MANTKKITKAIVTTGAANLDLHQTQEEIQLYAPNGAAAGVVVKQAAQADSTATDVPGLKTDFNALLAKLRSAGVIS